MQRQAERLPRSRNRGRPCNSEAARRFTPKAFGAGSAAATRREAATAASSRGRQKHVFLRNEPTVLRQIFWCNCHCKR